MMSSDYLIANFYEYVEFKSSNKSLDEFLNKGSNFKSFENFDVVQEDLNNNLILKEIKQWKKFYKNNWKKSSLRDFEPFYTSGDISNFIKNQLSYFVSENTPNLPNMNFRVRLPDPEKIFWRVIDRKVNQLTGLPTADALRQAAVLTKEIAFALPQGNIRDTFMSNVDKFIFNGKQGLEAKRIGDLLGKAIGKFENLMVDKKSQNNLIDFIFRTMTDTSFRDVDDDATLVSRMKIRWLDFLKEEFFKVDRRSDITPLSFFNVIEDVIRDISNDVLTTRNIFEFNFQDSLFKAMNNQLSPFDFKRKTLNNVRVFGRQMFRISIISMGLDPKDFRTIERIVVSNLSSIADTHLGNLASSIVNKTFSTLQGLEKSKMWANKTLAKFFEYGRLIVDRDGLYEWVYGDTNHCPSCLKANGQRHRLKDWHLAGLLPQNNGSKDLICGGFNCKCKLVRVTGSSLGRLDRIPTQQTPNPTSVESLRKLGRNPVSRRKNRFWN